MRIPVHLVTGATAAGKSTAILRMLAQRPHAEHWAVLVNDFGAVNLRTAASACTQRVSVREVGGCICCTAQVSLRTALVALLRAVRPHRLLIEASSAARPTAIVKLLREPGVAATAALARSVCVIDPRQLADPRYASSETYRAQVRSADTVLIGRSDVTTADERAAARRMLEKLGPAQIVDSAEHVSLL